MNNYDAGMLACDDLMHAVRRLYSYADMASLFDSPEISQEVAKVADCVRECLAEKTKHMMYQTDMFE